LGFYGASILTLYMFIANADENGFGMLPPVLNNELLTRRIPFSAAAMRFTLSLFNFDGDQRADNGNKR
jgi:hypothetical protein